jgi:Cu-Zn family superoxide dismutase
MRALSRKCLLIGIILFLVSSAVADMHEGMQHSEKNSEATPKNLSAKAVLYSTADGSNLGEVRVTGKGSGSVSISGEISNLTPGLHGFHVHETGDCSDSGKAAGGHFDPFKSQHGAPKAESYHAGDLGNIEANEAGVARVQKESQKLALGYGSASVFGRAFIVHENADDLNSQPSGNAGSRVACGIIGVIEAQ